MSKLAELQARREERLWNWARWWNGFDSNGGAKGTCASAERRYVAPRDEDQPNEGPSHKGVAIDVRDAEWIEAGVKRLPKSDGKLLRLMFIELPRSHPWRVARALKVSVVELQRWHERAVTQACVEADRLRDNLGQVMLIRRGSMLWAGVASAERTVYKSAHIVASATLMVEEGPADRLDLRAQRKTKSPA